jgi:hypothetical protein
MRESSNLKSFAFAVIIQVEGRRLSALPGDAAAPMANRDGINGSGVNQAQTRPLYSPKTENGLAPSPSAGHRAKGSQPNGAYPTPNGVKSVEPSGSRTMPAQAQVLEELPVVTSEFVNLGDLAERVAARVFTDLQNLVEVSVCLLVLVDHAVFSSVWVLSGCRPSPIRCEEATSAIGCASCADSSQNFLWS